MPQGSDGKPFTIEVTPGAVTAASSTSVTVQIKDGPAKTFAIDAQTHVRATPTNGEQVGEQRLVGTAVGHHEERDGC